MNSDKRTHSFDVQAFARAGGVRDQETALTEFPRLVEAAALPLEGRKVAWRVQGALRRAETEVARTWLHLQAEAIIPMTCQRCLEPVDMPLLVDRWFRFVADEAAAEFEDETAEEDVLALDPHFDLLALVEDELLMALPFVPRHATCSSALPMHHEDADFEEAQQAQPNPFGALVGVKLGPGKSDN